MLSKIRHYVPTHELRSIYHAIFSSHLTYGCQIWGQHNTQMDMICKLQNRALRIINFENFQAQSSPLYKASKIMKIQDLVSYQNILHIHDYLNNKLPHCFHGYFLKLDNIYNIQTRNAELGCLFIPSKNTTNYGLKSITQQCILSWNNISKQLNTNLLRLKRNKLKTILNQHFLDQY